MDTTTTTHSSASLQALPTPVLETQLLTLAGHVAAAQCRFLQLLAEYDRRDGWAGPGLQSCAQWLSWRIGMSRRTASEHVRVARALARLPAVAAAFAAGRISYSKVRAITRLVDETAPQPTDRGRPVGAAGATDVASGSATDSTLDEVKQSQLRPVRDSSTVGSAAPLADDAEQTLLGVAMNGTASHVETVVRATRRRLIDPMRPAALRGVSWRWADDGTLILRGRFTPDAGAALIAAIDALVPPDRPVCHDDPPAPEGWRESAPEQQPGTVVDRRAAQRADALVQLATRADHASGSSGAAVNVVLHLETDSEPRAELLAGAELPTSTAERLACDAQVQALLEDKQSNRLYLGRRQRLATPAQIAALQVRDGRCCQFPGCANTRFLHAHHVRHWLHGGRTDLNNLVLICTFHHAVIHDRGYRIEANGRGWLFRRPDGSAIPHNPEPLEGRAESLIEMSTRAGLAITRNSLTPSWGGERLDLFSVLDRLLPRVTRQAA